MVSILHLDTNFRRDNTIFSPAHPKEELGALIGTCLGILLDIALI